MSTSKKAQISPSRARILRAVATSTAIETGQDAELLEQFLARKKRSATRKYKVQLAS